MSDKSTIDRSETRSDATIDNELFDNSQDAVEEEFGFKLKPDSIWNGWQGISIMIIGVILPALMLFSAGATLYDRITILLLKQPLETITELILALSIPAGNFIVWSALCKGDCRSTIKRGILNGVAIGSAAIITAVTATAVTLQYPAISSDGTNHSAEVLFIWLIFLGSLIISIHLAVEVRKTRIVRSSQIRAAAYVAVGTIVSLLAFAGAEARSTLIRIAEYMAISETVDKKEQGFDMLQKLDPKREMMMECANAKAGGLPGMFVKIDNVTMRQLYFSVTGEPFRDEKSANFASMPDDYHKRHVVGAPVDGLSLHRSKMHGYINPDTLTSTIYWTFVFKNKSYESQEARAELGLPEGSVVSGMTLWQDGKPQRTVFSPTGNQGGSTATSWTNVGHDAPGIVTDLGRGRVLLHCYPVPAQGQLKMSVAVSVPLTLHTLEQASLPMPRLIDTNFSLSGQHNLRMLCDSQISLKAKGLTQSKAPTGKYIVSGKIEKETLSGAAVSLKVTRQATLGPIACKDELSKTPRYLIQTIKKIPSIAPKHLVIVLDGSKSVSPYLKDLKEVLNKVSKSIPTSLIVASNQSKEGPRTESLSQALGTLKAVNFKGGQDNLESLVKATELAGESAGGAVLWIHGPQPSFNKEIYIVSQAFAKPDFYELALDNGVMDPNEYLKHHSEIGPFTAIARSGSAADNLNLFLLKWRQGGHEYQVEYKISEQAPKLPLIAKDQAREVAALFAKENCARYLANDNLIAATEEAVYHRIVTPVSLASTSNSGPSNDTESLAMGMHNHSVHILGANNELEADMATIKKVKADSLDRAPALQGATNGTIGPQDATAIMGVNTAGTVRVNNLANLEALLNLFAIAIEILGILGGGILAITALFVTKSETENLKAAWNPNRLAFGLMMIVVALTTPGILNYFISSARDANLFS